MKLTCDIKIVDNEDNFKQFDRIISKDIDEFKDQILVVIREIQKKYPDSLPEWIEKQLEKGKKK